MIAYLDCFAGASGDMILGALVDAGADLEAVRKQVSQIDLGPVDVTASTVYRGGIRAARIRIEGGGSSVMRTYADAVRILDGASLDPEIRARSGAVLRRLASAEARVHGVSIDEVRFHELDGVDTIVDVVGAAAALSNLGAQRVVASPVATGRGLIRAEHGVLPNPAPAVLELLKGAALYQRDVESELVTPTGAALLAEVAESFGLMPRMTVSAIGYGAGSRDLEIPNVVRVVLGEALPAAPEGIEELLIETNIDDMNPEFYEYVSERLFSAGANDVWLTPAIGKRGRPANVLSVLAPAACEEAVRDVLTTETSSIGVRSTPVRKWMLERGWAEVEVEGRPVRVKIARRQGEVVNMAPEYADCAGVAKATGLPLKEVFRRALAEASPLRGS